MYIKYKLFVNLWVKCISFFSVIGNRLDQGLLNKNQSCM